MNITINLQSGEINVGTNRQYKGKSLLELINEYVVIDLETTGYDPQWNEIIEIAAIKIKDGKEIDFFCTFVKPNESIDTFITSLTGITNEMVKNAPRLSEVIVSLDNFIGQSIILGHNVNFDINFLYDAYKIYHNRNFTNNFIDTLRISRKLFNDFENHKLKTLCNKFSIDEIYQHRALSDARITYKAYEYMKKYINDNSIDITLKYKKPYTYHKPLYQEVVATVDNFNEEHPLYNKKCVFTGALEKMHRKEAMQYVVNCGGLCKDSISKDLDYLIVGNFDYCSNIKEGKSSKVKKAEEYILEGFDINILSENVFYDLIGLNVS